MRQDILKEMLHYDPETGVFTWIQKKARLIRVGDEAGTVDAKGYRRIRINRQAYAAHRLAFLYMIGEFPPNEVDHIDGIRSNNKWANLRPATKNENAQNRKATSANGRLLGVTYHKAQQRWRAQIRTNGKQLLLGAFRSAEEAHSAYLAAKHEYHSFQPIPR